MIAPPDVSYADVLYAAFRHLVKEFKPNHPELVDQIIFDNDAVETIYEILCEMKAHKEQQACASINIPVGHA